MKLINLDLPNFAKKEIEKLQEVIAPFAKKASRYIFWSFPLIVLSIINIVTMLFGAGFNESITPSLVVYAIMGALGMALSKEAKLQQAEIQKVSMDYIVERIKKSEVVSDRVKEKYISLVKERPLQTLNHFVNFLEVENRVMN
ncbi:MULTISPECIES: DUF5392 family protein [Bacillaceae]|uniref:DUF5392 family protein n=1 Tax=Bacillaceae TaxID=186817 RepID=UPI000BFBA638|nr:MULTISPECIES: DUF5392 family protein [Bacillaceae]PGT88624.1 hypothetical protein COD11_05890 [Bacillus sp. AFS040349]UGB31918.1 YwnF family protein [Metabacillus sp. B2-18]